MLCTFEGCVNTQHSRGLCKSHYKQQWLGKPLKTLQRQYRNLTPIIRFKKYVRIDPETQCWEWLAHRHVHSGYGLFALDGRMQRAHRVAWLLFKGPIPADPRHKYNTLGVLHHCENKACVNPDHLFLGTQRDNARDAIRKGWQPGNCGEQHHRARLSAAQVYAIRAAKLPRRLLAETYGVSVATIKDIRSRRSWRHLPEEPMNVILTQHGSVPSPDPPAEGVVMAEAPDFPRIYYSAEEPTGRIFQSQEELTAAGGTWFKTPTEAADAAAKAPAAPPAQAPAADDDPHTPRSRR